MPLTIENPAGATAIRPFTIPKVPEAELQALRARITANRRPDQETVPDDSQGEPLALIEELARYSAADYDWRCEAKLDTLPQAPPLCGAAGLASAAALCLERPARPHTEPQLQDSIRSAQLTRTPTGLTLLAALAPARSSPQQPGPNVRSVHATLVPGADQGTGPGMSPARRIGPIGNYELIPAIRLARDEGRGPGRPGRSRPVQPSAIVRQAGEVGTCVHRN